MSVTFLTSEDGQRYEERLGALEQGGGAAVASVEPAEDDIPKVFFGGPLQQSKTEAVVPFRYISKTQDITGYAEIKAQGNSSMSYAKKNQTVKLFEDEACETKLKVNFKGWGKQNKHCYKANWIDLSHARNVVSARLWADVVKSRSNYAELPQELRTSPNQGAVDGFPVKVYAAGVYQGRYTLNIPKDKWMANMDDDLDTHCILCGENYVSGCFRAAANINGSDWSDEIHDTVPASIKTRWNEVISFVMNATDEEFRANLGNYFYVDSLIDYYLFGLASCDLDGFGKNQIYMTYDGQRWIASAYDKDSTWGLYWNGSKFVATDYARTSYEDYVHTSGNLLYNRLEQLFWAELQTRWAELKSGALSMTNIINRFERFTDIAPAELVAEDYASTTGGGKFTGIPSQSTNNIQQIRAFALARQVWTDEYVAALTPEVEVPCEGITLDADTLTFTAEGEQTITATATPDGCTDSMVWVSSAPSVATISVDGAVCTVTAVANGDTTITVTCGDYSASCSVAVSGLSEAIACTGITLDQTELTFDGEGSQTLTATVVPSDTTDIVVWSSSNKSIATVENGVVTAKKNGSATITATCGSQTANCKVTVSGIVDETLLYSLAEETTFNGTSDYIDTGIQLFDTDKDFTVFLDFQSVGSLINNATLFFCMTEVTPYPGLCVRSNTVGVHQTTTTTNTSYNVNSTSNRTKVAITYTAGSGKVITNVACATGIHRNLSTAITYAEVTQTALIGCYQIPDGTKGRYWAGTVYGCEIYNRVLTEEEIREKISTEIITAEVEWSETAEYTLKNGVLGSGSNYTSDAVAIPDSVTTVTVGNVDGAGFTWFGVWQYDESMSYLTGKEIGGSADYVVTLNNATKYIRLSAFPQTSDCTDPATQIALTYEQFVQ